MKIPKPLVEEFILSLEQWSRKRNQTPKTFVEAVREKSPVLLDWLIENKHITPDISIDSVIRPGVVGMSLELYILIIQGRHHEPAA